MFLGVTINIYLSTRIQAHAPNIRNAPVYKSRNMVREFSSVGVIENDNRTIP